MTAPASVSSLAVRHAAPASRDLVLIARARKALAEARTVAEADDVRRKAAALEVYSRRRDGAGEAESCANEIRLRAERRIGELSANLPRKPGPGRGRKRTPRSGDLSGGKEATLKAAGIVPQRAREYEAFAGIPAPVFEETLKAAEPSRRRAALMRAARERRRESRTRALARPARLGGGPYPLILADPPWRYEGCPTDARRIENHYPTMALDEIKALGPDVSRVAAGDCVLYLWATAPKLAEATEVLRAWGFEYRTCLVWVKDRAGMGYWARQRHELLLVAVRGSPPPPRPNLRPDSVIEAPRGRHSEKPAAVHEMLERQWPEWEGARLEMFARRARPGWTVWGAEAPAA